MFTGVFGGLLNQSGFDSSNGGMDGGARRKASAPRGSKKNGAGRPFLAYEKLTLDELKVKAKKYKVKGYSGMTKAQLIAALRAK